MVMKPMTAILRGLAQKGHSVRARFTAPRECSDMVIILAVVLGVEFVAFWIRMR
jgi:hypothetical protein